MYYFKLTIVLTINLQAASYFVSGEIVILIVILSSSLYYAHCKYFKLIIFRSFKKPKILPGVSIYHN